MSQHDSLFLTLVIPFYNEESSVRPLFHEWQKALQESGISFQILAIEDGSKDQTRQKLNDLKEESNLPLHIIEQKNAGHGEAVFQGYSLALKSKLQENHWILQIDSDRQVSPDDFSKLWEKRESADLVTGIRSPRQDPFLRCLLSNILALALSLLMGKKLSDPNIPYRLIKASFLEEALALTPRKTFAPNILLTMMAAQKNSLSQVPVTHFPRQKGETSISLRNLFSVGTKCLKQTLSFYSKVLPSQQSQRE